MRVEEKHRVSRMIVDSLSKIKYYEEVIKKIKGGRVHLYEANMSCRLMKVRSTIWVDLTPDEVIMILKRKVNCEKQSLKTLESKIK